MSAHAEYTLMLHLLDPDSLDVLASEGVSDDCIPTEEYRPIIRWCIDYYLRSGRKMAPSIKALRSEQDWANVLDDHEVPLGQEDPEDSIEWAIEALKAQYVQLAVQKFNKEFAKSMAEAEIGDKVAVLDAAVTELADLSMQVTSRDEHADLRFSVHDRLLAYDDREANKGSFYGAVTGFDEIDEHTYGIHPGELAIFSGGPKTGKSFWIDFIALNEWRAGRSVALFTLENSVEMTLDRIACMECSVDINKWQRGDIEDFQRKLVAETADRIAKSDNALHVLQPDLGKRSVEHMVRQAQVLDVDTIFVDQLTFVELPSERLPRHERIGIALHTFKGLISTGRKRMPGLIVHQINREGVKNAEKYGHHRMTDLAESAEVERTADWVFSVFRSVEHRNTGLALVQTLASRRAEIKWWEVKWGVAIGDMNVRREKPVAA